MHLGNARAGTLPKSKRLARPTTEHRRYPAPDPRRSSSVGSSIGVRRGRTPRQLSREEHELSFRKLRERQGVNFNARGCETSYQAYLSAVIRARACGSAAFNTTNGQRSQAMDKRGRGRCARTLQRHHRLLELMGLMVVGRVRRRDRPGYPDRCLRLRLIQSYVAPPTAPGVGPSDTPPLVPATASDSAGFAGKRPPPASPAGNGSDEEVTRIRTDWTGAGGELVPLDEIRAELAAYEAELAAQTAAAPQSFDLQAARRRSQRSGPSPWLQAMLKEIRDEE